MFWSCFLFHQHFYFCIRTYKLKILSIIFHFFSVFHKAQKNNSGNVVIKRFSTQIEFPCIPHYQIPISSVWHLPLYIRQGNNFGGKQFTVHVYERKHTVYIIQN